MALRAIYRFSELSNEGNNWFAWRHTQEDLDGADDGLPVPASKYMRYGETRAAYLQSGKQDSIHIEDIISRHHINGPVLDFGCSNGRVLRHLLRKGDRRELWGVDIDSLRVNWAIKYLGADFNILPISTGMHLPVEDRSFSLVYAYSIFTHLEDDMFGWLAEFRRVLKPGGLAFLTICDEATVERAKTATAFVNKFIEEPEYSFSDETVSMDIRRVGPTFQTFIKRDFFVSYCSRFFEFLEIVEPVMSIQSGVLLRKP